MGLERSWYARMRHLGAAILTDEPPFSPMRPLLTPRMIGIWELLGNSGLRNGERIKDYRSKEIIAITREAAHELPFA
jgi:hypothetical protein